MRFTLLTIFYCWQRNKKKLYVFIYVVCGYAIFCGYAYISIMTDTMSMTGKAITVF